MTPTEKSSETTNPNFVGKIAVSETPPSELLPHAKPLEDRYVDTKEAPVELYEGKFGKPYLVDVMDIAELWGKSGFEDKIHSIDKYVLDQINARELQKTKSSYRQVISQLSNQLNIEPNLQYDKKVERIATYIGLMNNLKELELKKKALEYARPN